MNIHAVPSRMVTDYWSAVEPMLRKAMRWHPFLDSAGLLYVLLTGFASLVVITEQERIIGAAVLERVTYPTCIVANILAIGGSGLYQHGSELAEYFERWARSHGCNYLSATGRPGWERVTARFGSQRNRIVQVWKSLDAERH